MIIKFGLKKNSRKLSHNHASEAEILSDIMSILRDVSKDQGQKESINAKLQSDISKAETALLTALRKINPSGKTVNMSDLHPAETRNRDD